MAAPVTMTPIPFQAVDQLGQAFDGDAVLPDYYSPQYHSLTLAPGETRAGWLGFEIPKNTTTVTITWSDSSNINPPAEIARYTR